MNKYEYKHSSQFNDFNAIPKQFITVHKIVGIISNNYNMPNNHTELKVQQ